MSFIHRTSTLSACCIAAAALVIAGCAKSVYVHPDREDFQGRSERLPLSAELMIEDGGNRFTLRDPGQKRPQRFHLDYAVQVYGRKALEQVFREVTLYTPEGTTAPGQKRIEFRSDAGRRKADRIVKLSLGPGSKVDLGDKLIGEKTMEVELLCRVYDAGGEKLLWEGRGMGRSAKSYKTLYGPVDAASSLLLLQRPVHGTLLQMIATESIMASLEQINDGLLGAGKAAVLKAE
ncbi:MAG: hypothetical protein HY924_16540 [Elusimicrobia bacterium]|nr:hypothetical protein [Elusimicrobiota bacterium]